MSNTQEIKISVPEGKKAVYDEAMQTIKFVDVEPVRSKTWAEFCDNHKITSNEYYITTDSLLSETHRDSIERRFITDKNLLETKEDAKGILALIQLKRLHDEWVSKHDPQCYAIVNENAGICICHKDHRERRFLEFPTHEMATEFMKYFFDLIVAAKMFL